MYRSGSMAYHGHSQQRNKVQHSENWSPWLPSFILFCLSQIVTASGSFNCRDRQAVLQENQFEFSTSTLPAIVVMRKSKWRQLPILSLVGSLFVHLMFCVAHLWDADEKAGKQKNHSAEKCTLYISQAREIAAIWCYHLGIFATHLAV